VLVRRFCVYNVGLREILTVIMTSNDENVHSCKRHTVIHHAFCFWRSLCPFLALRLTTVSLDTLAGHLLLYPDIVKGHFKHTILNTGMYSELQSSCNSIFSCVCTIRLHVSRCDLLLMESIYVAYDLANTRTVEKVAKNLSVLSTKQYNIFKHWEHS